MNKIVLFTIAVVMALSHLGIASAEQHAVQTPLGEKVVHTRLAPVLLHRAVPPFAGKHVYQGRLR